MRQLTALQQATDEVEARVVIDHAIEHLDADLRWINNAASRVEFAGTERKVRG